MSDLKAAQQVLDAYSAAVSAIVDAVRPAVVRVQAAGRGGPHWSPGRARTNYGSGVIVDAAAAVARDSGKPVLVFANVATGIEPRVRERADALGLPLLQGTRASLRAMEALVRYADQGRRGRQAPPPSPVTGDRLLALRQWLATHPAGLTEQAGKRLLAAYGVRATREALATSAGQAARLARQIGPPIALKIQSPDIPHKTEAGGVLLNLRGPTAVRRGYREIVGNARRYDPAARIDGVLVQEMAPPDAVEVIVGSALDEEFGLGGVWVEILRDSSLRLAPVSRAEALEMIAETRAAPLLRGYRGRPPADADALADAICRVSHLAADLQDMVAAVDINPLMVLPAGQGVLAADALVVLRA